MGAPYHGYGFTGCNPVYPLLLFNYFFAFLEYWWIATAIFLSTMVYYIAPPGKVEFFLFPAVLVTKLFGSIHVPVTRYDIKAGWPPGTIFSLLCIMAIHVAVFLLSPKVSLLILCVSLVFTWRISPITDDFLKLSQGVLWVSLACVCQAETDLSRFVAISALIFSCLHVVF